MDILHLCRLCLKTSGYHFNIFTEIISSKHLYQFINNLCELGVFRNDGYPEHICENCFQFVASIICFKTQAKETEATLTRMKRFRIMNLTEQNEKDKEVKGNEEAVDPAFDHSTGNQVAIKSEIDIDEIAFPTEQVEIGKITEMEESASWKHFNEMENIPAMIERSESQEILTKQKCKEEIEGNEEAMDLAFLQSTVKQEEVSAISLDGNASSDEDKSTSQEKAIKSEIDIDEIAIPTEQVQIEKITEMKATGSLEYFSEMEIIKAGIETLESQEFSEDRTRMECHHCGEKRETKQEIAQHIVDVHNSIFNEDNTPIQQQRQDIKHTCSMRERRFKNKSNLTRHMRKHTGEKSFQCNICNYRCSRNWHLQVHMRKHTGEKPFQCNICNNKFFVSGDLKVHMQIHTGEKPFHCNICNYKCSESGRLQVHMRTHTGEKPFQCNICNYKSSVSGNLKVHMRKHTGEKPYHCNICNYKCSESGRLQVHMRTHTGEKPFQCNICNYKCSQSGCLQVHMRKHTGEKPFQCDICNYRFSGRGNLKVHMQKHTGEKPFQCNICNYRCSQSWYLKPHMRKHT